MKVQLTIAVHFVSSKDTDDKREMHSNSDKIEIMIFNKRDEVVKYVFESFLNRCQVGLKTSTGGSDSKCH